MGQTHNGPGNGTDVPFALAAGADGSSLFVTGYSLGSGTSNDYATVAYGAATGAKRWVRRYNAAGNGADLGSDVAVDPDGSQLFVTGLSVGSASGADFATLAYDAATGSRLWLRRYNGPGNGRDAGFAVGVAPDGTRVFATGDSDGSTSGADYATLGYSTG